MKRSSSSLLIVATVLAASVPTRAMAAEFRAGRAFVHAFDLNVGKGVIAEIAENGSLVRTFGSEFAMDTATSLQFMPNGSLVVPCGANNIAYVFGPSGNLTGTMTLSSAASGGSSLSHRGWLYFADPTDEALVERFANITSKTFVAQYGIVDPRDVSIDSFDRILVSSFGTDRVVRVDSRTGTVETLGDNVTTHAVTRFAVTRDRDVFALRAGSDSIGVVRSDGVTTDVIDVAAMTPTAIAMAPDGTVAVLSRDSYEIVHIDPDTKSVVRRIDLPSNLYALQLAYAPAYFDAKVKCVTLPDESDAAPIRTTIKGARVSIDLGTLCTTVTIPPKYAQTGLVASFLQYDVTFRLQPGFTAGATQPTSGFGSTGGGYFSIATEIATKAGKPGNPQVTRLRGVMDFYGLDAAHLEFTTTKRRK